MLKQIIFYFTWLSLVGCQTIIPKVPTSSNLLNSSGCSAQPRVSLNSKDVETLTLDQGTITRSGQVSVSQHVGYTFTATAGEKLSYSTDADVCLWVFTPDNQIVKGGDLSKDGKYVIPIILEKMAREVENKIINARIVVVNLLNLILLEVIPKK